MSRLTYEINKSAESLAKISHGRNVKAVIERHDFFKEFFLWPQFSAFVNYLFRDVVQQLFENTMFDTLGLFLQDHS